MEDELENLSDAQIRDQLKLFGVNTGPVTQSTRSILLKKLRSLKSGQSISTGAKAKQRRSIATSSPAQGRTKLAGFSSDEEEIPIKKPTSKNSPSSASRRRSAFPQINQSKNVENDDTNENNLDGRVSYSSRPMARRSLPRSFPREINSRDTLPGGSKNGPTMIYDEEVEHIAQEKPTSRRYSFEFEDEDAEGVLLKNVDTKGSQQVDKGNQKTAKGSKSEISTVTTRHRLAAREFTGKVDSHCDSSRNIRISSPTFCLQILFANFARKTQFY